MFNKEKIKIKNFNLLKTSAEEGYIVAMYELGQFYYENKNEDVSNLKKSLAWHREACKNGYILSYVSFINLR